MYVQIVLCMYLSHLDPGLGEVDLHGDLLARVDVRVVRLLERSFQLLLHDDTDGPSAATTEKTNKQSSVWRPTKANRTEAQKRPD